ncbi:MAG: biopolymer transporter ExbD [Planctomycetota bacterium]|nr:MAG: biopolymer transporter ExbD [Planctomycetota bacterium]REJ89450.1 MAG: biopolymer transporter ExbD [Planctomycetota bacterium]REK28979.1 MAG: biopolymer transporter ExbD [Planctomycetota bacterium]REK39587.1 MAG: biopolymer transporter ExbD [Planctomycetota bacterium]
MRFKKSDSSGITPDMTPMIDMTFQLITFFMVVINFEQTQADERIKLPADQLAIPPKQARENELILNVGIPRDEDGNEIGEPAVYYGGVPVPVLEYGANLKAERDQALARNKDLEDITVVIRADATVETGLIQELMQLAQEQGFTKFTFKAMQENPDGQ